MKVDKVFINTYKYDFHLAKICIGSIRYWYPDIPIYLIKDEKEGRFDTSQAEKAWNVKVLNIQRKKFGWGYGKLEVLFLEHRETFFVIDADAVITGLVIDVARKTEADFIVDEEVQPTKRFNEIYYNLNRIHELDTGFIYPGYSFNSGQWFGTSTIIKREDFSTLTWSEPPVSRDRDIVVNNDQGHLNYIVHLFEQRKLISVARIKLMVWPVEGRADFIGLQDISNRLNTFPYVIHWAGMSNVKFSALPRRDILKFYQSYYYSKLPAYQKQVDVISRLYLKVQRKFSNKLKR